MRKRIPLAFFASLLSICLMAPQQALAEGEIVVEETILCPQEPVGLTQVESLNSGIAFDCVPSAWEVYKVNARFNNSYSIYNEVVQQFGDRNRKDRDITYSLELICKAKKLRANLYIGSSELVEGYGVAYRIKTGAVSVKFDSAAFKKFKYIEPKIGPVFIQDSKKFTAELLKTKNKFIMKINSEELGNSVVDFPILDLAKYKSRFKSFGCPLN